MVTLDTAPALPVQEAVLFAFDDYAIPWRSHVTLSLVQAEKHPANPVLRCGPAGAPDATHAVLYGSVLWIEGKFRMWYLGMFQPHWDPEAIGWWRPMCYAESEDGVHWTKPDLGLVELDLPGLIPGVAPNNVCLIEGEPYSLSRVNDFLSVIYEPDDPDPARRYKTVFIAHMPFEEVRGGRSGIGPDESRWGSLVCATSADGLRWRVGGDRPANSGDERFEVSGLFRRGDFYYATGQLISPWAWRPDGSEIGRVMMTYRSPDFAHWSPAKALSFARPGQLSEPPIPGQQTHMGAGIWNRGNVLVGLYGMWDDGPTRDPKDENNLQGTRIDLGLVTSHDGIHWREPVPGFKTIPRGAEGEWDAIALCQGHAFAEVGDSTYVWYSHWDCEELRRSQEIGLATLRRDGFGYLSLRDPEVPGHVVTCLARPDGPVRVLVNVEGVSAERPLAVELLDARDRPLPGYSGSAAGTVSVDGVRQEVQWAGTTSGAIAPGEPFAIRATLPPGASARLYALYVAS